jgi:cellulose synthase/poly-beta-1,6-N-acetylglucosamine synthase-like glycosyltransferase/spore germination protein YaaH/peptidoglycan/xylan/chitin deacetylase (PgdA/CDA1 family)
MTDYAVFFDPSRKRWSWVKRISTVLGLLSVIIVSTFLISVFVTTPFLPVINGITKDIKRTLRRPIRLPHQARLTQFLLRKQRNKLLSDVRRDQALNRARAAQPPIKTNHIVAAFYAPWQETGLHSLAANADKMTHLMPVWVHLNESGTGLDYRDWDLTTVPHNVEVLTTARTHHLNIVPVISNAHESDFDPVRLHTFLTKPELQDRVIMQLRNWVLANRFQGINVDFENAQPGDEVLYVPFFRRLRAAFAPSHLLVSADLEANRDADWQAVSALCDYVVVMAYDENTKTPGPIASINWYRDKLERAHSLVPPEKLVVGIANYAYDWTYGQDWAEPLTYQGALVRARDYRPDEKPEQVIDYDDAALNPTFAYVDDEGKGHEVWFLDAVTAANQWMIAQNYNVRGVAVWVLGSTDPSIWKFIGRDSLTVAPNPRELRQISFPYDVEFVGEGEILHVSALPADGARDIEVDQLTGLILDESYHKLPTSYVIGRTGYKDHEIALTIDDGPANPYTEQMLDILKKYGIHATFFLIGQNAERYPNLVRRIWDEGHEIGNHSYTHPNIGTIGDARARAEINATQRVFQSILHRSTLLFRPPYNADAEPSQIQEVVPLTIASSLNYITVGEFLDPQDWMTEVRDTSGNWRPRTAEQMRDTIFEQLRTEKGNCVLLHDGGGDRDETVRLLPMLIESLRAKGYKFVTVSQLVNSTRDAVNPPVSSRDTFMLASDRIVFEAIYLFELFLSIAFVSGIILGTLRMIFVLILAMVEKRKSKKRTFDESYRPRVSVVIAAFNEEKVIARTIDAVLANHYPDLEVVVVDDGSSDGTSAVVLSRFANHPQVCLLQQENGGKAAALNRGIAQASGDIIIALDADTLFARDTIIKLVRPFSDPLVGAVAGNVKVGNRINPLTYWQAIEYITSQNLDRRAYAVINSVTVVPGAVGAWRREAVLQGGGYTTDTMAEDMDLTWRIRRIGWRVETMTDALGYTEAPDSFASLFKQRFRWAFGTLQCLWKHRRAIGRYGWFGKVMLPSLWLFQVIYQALSPLIDLEILWTLANVGRAFALRGIGSKEAPDLTMAINSLYLIGFMYAFFFVVELVGSAVAFRLDREDNRVLVWLFWQRFLYRQLMYAVLLKSLKTALSGMRAGWGKLERKGTVELAAAESSAASG